MRLGVLRRAREVRVVCGGTHAWAQGRARRVRAHACRGCVFRFALGAYGDCVLLTRHLHLTGAGAALCSRTAGVSMLRACRPPPRGRLAFSCARCW